MQENPDVSLVELIVHRFFDEFDIGDFTQEIEDVHMGNWQAPFNEKYLDETREPVIGDGFDLPETKTDSTRLTFFIYYLDLKKPLIKTPFGDITLPILSNAPIRIADLIEYQDPE